MAVQSELRAEIKKRMLKVGDDRILDLTDLELKSNSAFYGVCSIMKIPAKSFVVKWPKCFIERRRKASRNFARRLATKAKSATPASAVKEVKEKKTAKKPTKKVTKRVVNETEKNLLPQNREADYSRVLKLNKSLYEEIDMLKKIIETNQNNSARVSILDKEKRLLEENICTLRAKLDDAKKEYDDLVEYYEGQDKLLEGSKFVCPSCGSVVSPRNVEDIKSGHKLISCPICRSKNAMEKEDLVLVFRCIKEGGDID